MEKQLLKQLLSIEFYDQNKDKLSPTLFEDDLLELYEVIVDSHTKYGADINKDELTNMWLDKNPVATNSTKRTMINTIESILEEDLINPDMASDLLKGLWTRDLGKRIADQGLRMAQGKEGSFERVRKLVEDNLSGVLPTDFGEETTKDISKLLEFASDANKFRFNINSLAKVCYGIGRGDFGIIFARPETGKTAFSVSLPFGPAGYADQGLRVAYLGNEEATEKTMLRAISCWTGMTKPEITEAPKLAMERFELISDKVTMQNVMGWDVNRIEAFIHKTEADVVLLDQGDKTGIEGNFDSDHQRLRTLYTTLREIPKRQNCALWAVSQASAVAEGKTVLTADMMEGSKTGKYAEADIILGVGKYPDNEDGTDDPIRFISFCKNKITGWHGTVTTKLEKGISRYVD